MKNRSHILLAAVALAGCQPREKSIRELSEPDTPIVSRPEMTAETLIVPGESAGMLSLNEDAANAIKLLGKPDSSDAAMGKAVIVWYPASKRGDDLTAVYSERKMGVDETARIRMIRVTSPAYTTAEGIHTGKSIEDIRQHYRLEAEASFGSHGYTYTIFGTGQGISFEVNADSLLTGIIVHDSARNAKSGSLPFHPGAKIL
ncbi:hypothetical protein MKQ70_16760 [Chitinophaga sedimenti]|uniref:hypothetical protein n=1 Tax=Chitinophaga sedimenti TaxID=2033606 RepID=UPI002005013B|nr:hypothetical protein [Chitinophaga sedimenti]MCK7556578.1 hypothetical protein [Chitinophaga sedimenti]